MMPVLKDKGSVHPKTEGKGCNHLGYVYPAWVKRYGCKKNTMFIQPRITGVKWLKLYQDLDLNQIRSWFKTPSKTMGGKGHGKEELTPPLVLLVLCVLSILCKANSLKTQRFVFTILIFGRNIRGDHLNMLVIWESRFAYLRHLNVPCWWSWRWR